MLGLRKSASDAVQQGDEYFRWRGGSVSRLESLFDAVIALALTLIVVSVDVPKSFDELMLAFRKLPAFAICFAILLMCWYYHFLFHRRYGLEGYPVVILNCVLMFLVVFYVYPLKFLYTFMFAQQGEVQIDQSQMGLLMALYSGGFVAIFVVMLLLHIYAWTRRKDLELNRNEEIQTRMKIAEHGIYILIGMLSIGIACLGGWAPLAGMIYALIGPAQFANAFWWTRKLQLKT